VLKNAIDWLYQNGIAKRLALVSYAPHWRTHVQQLREAAI